MKLSISKIKTSFMCSVQTNIQMLFWIKKPPHLSNNNALKLDRNSNTQQQLRKDIGLVGKT